MMDAFRGVPNGRLARIALAGFSSPVIKISQRIATYSTFDAASTDVLRLDFVPMS
jgi:hypothetical protein